MPELDEAIREQLNKIAHSTMLGLANVPSILLAEKIIEVVPEGLKKYSIRTPVLALLKLQLRWPFNIGSIKENRRNKDLLH